MKRWQQVGIFSLIFFLFLFRGYVTQDPDFGWHIQAGNYILKHGIEITDPFSYSMPSYPFVDHEWLTNLLWALLFTTFGIMPLFILYSFLAIGSLFLVTQVIKEKKWIVLPLFLASGTLLDFVGVRTQVLTWFFLSLLLYVLLQKKLWEKWRVFLPVLFLFWANMHGGFGIGLGVLFIVLVGRCIEERKQIREKLLIAIVCTGVTLINPFGIRLWWEFWMQLSDSHLRWSIAEWLPAIYFTNLAFWIYFITSLMFVVRYWKKYTRTDLFLYFFFLMTGLSSMRNIPIWILVSFSLTVKGFSLFAAEAESYEYGRKRFAIAYKGFFIIAACLFLPQLASFFYGVYLTRNEDAYPMQAVIYLQKYLPTQQIFSSYNWGGYLIWKLPEKKVFIDGRMPSWRWHADKKNESNYAFDEYGKVLAGQIPFSAFAAKYHIDTLLISPADLVKPEMKIFGIPIANNSILQKLVAQSDSFYRVVQQSKKMGWKEVYHDKTAIIYEKMED